MTARQKRLRADLRSAVQNLELVLDIIKRSASMSGRQIYGADLPSPRLDLLMLADVPMSLAHFYLGLAREAV